MINDQYCWPVINGDQWSILLISDQQCVNLGKERHDRGFSCGCPQVRTSTHICHFGFSFVFRCLKFSLLHLFVICIQFCIQFPQVRTFFPQVDDTDNPPALSLLLSFCTRLLLPSLLKGTIDQGENNLNRIDWRKANLPTSNAVYPIAMCIFNRHKSDLPQSWFHLHQ